MATFSSISFLLLTLTPLFIFQVPQIYAQSSSAPAPSPPGPINITAILEEARQFSIFIRFLKETQLGNQINTQVNSSTEGMTVFAPTDNAFNNLPSGTLNDLSDKQQIQLIQYHVLPKYYNQESLVTVSNPVRTQATGQDGHQFGLNFTGSANQLNVSTGIVNTQVYNALRKDPPLAIYQVDKVLLPVDFTMPPAPASSPPSPAAKGKKEGGAAAKDSAAEEPSPDTKPNGSGKMNSGLGLFSGVFIICMAMLS
ncbi:hypothetical protein Leryth_009992 [Lithospermum erythrorhizon]|nr:hypothetical protein Leryth_009992 [Lithospermum erythrorhizon]